MGTEKKNMKMNNKQKRGTGKGKENVKRSKNTKRKN